MRLVDRAYHEMIAHAEADIPREACGVLAGHRIDGDRVVEQAIRMSNTADAPRITYRIDPTELYPVVTTLESVGRDVLGFYHSHPSGPPTPSQRDRNAAIWSNHIYCLISISGSVPTLDAWEWTGETFVREPVVIQS